MDLRDCILVSFEEATDGDRHTSFEQCDVGDKFVSIESSVDLVEEGKISTLILEEGESSTYFEGGEFSNTGEGCFGGGDGDLETSKICILRFFIGTSAGTSLNRHPNRVDSC